MLYTRHVLIYLVPILVSCLTDVAVASEAGVFSLPYNPNQAWEACPGIGYSTDPDSHQYHTEYNEEFAKYHMGEDWNGRCGGSSDLGAELRAIADGSVVYVDKEGRSAKGKRVIIRYTLPDNTHR